MQILQLYIQGQRVDLFKDESVSITQSIKNVKDIDKIFTEFTQTFTLPASKENNRLFKHYYNFNIENGFDARLRVQASLEINSLPFKNGKLKLEGVDLKDRKPNLYRVTFFGSTVELSDLLGEDKLNILPLSQYNKNYGAGGVKGSLTTAESSTNHIIVPLITHTQRLFFDSDAHTPDDGNLYYHTGAGNNLHGVKWNELKYAIRVNKIIEAIEDQYTTTNGYPVSIQFSNDFFKNTARPEMDKLFMWLHRKSGKVENLSGNIEIETLIDDWPQSTQNGFFHNGTTFFPNPQVASVNSFKLIFDNPVSELDEYSVRVTDLGTTVFQDTAGAGDRTITTIPYSPFGVYQVFVTAQNPITFSDITWEVNYNDPITGNPAFVSFATPNFSTASVFQFNIAQQIPDMKVLELLTGLFKMFNLTAYVDETVSTETNKVIKVLPLDEYYSAYNSYNITEFVDTNKDVVNVALPYRQIVFKYKDTKTFLANRFLQLANKGFGEYDYSTGQSEIDGQLYKVEAPFSHMLFERLNDSFTGALKNIQWGYSVNESQNAYKGAPLLFYPIRQQSGGISFVNEVDEDNVAIGHERIWSVNMPSNSVSFNPVTNKSNINFFNETNEYTRNTEFTDTLFEDFYKNYIVDIFNTKRRLIKIKAFLPINIFTKLKLNDRLIVREQEYKINEIKTNLLTGESDIELLNII